MKERIKIYLKEKRITQKEFCDSIGVMSSYLSSTNKNIPLKKLTKIQSVYPELNIDWLMTGQGSMLKEVRVEEPIQPYSAVPSGDVFAYLREKDDEIRELRARIDTLVEEKHELELLVATMEKEQCCHASSTPRGDVAGDTAGVKVG